MSPIRKKALAWVLFVTAIAVAALAGSFIYLRAHHLTDKALIKVQLEAITAERGFMLDEARKAGGSDDEIAAYLAQVNKAEFDYLWEQLLATIAAIYVFIILGIFAFSLMRETRAEPPAL